MSDGIFAKALILNGTVKDIKSASEGVENELAREFTKTICSNNTKKCI